MLRARNETAGRRKILPGSEPIAIVGAACRFPGAPDLDSYWDLLLSGRDAVSTLPASRFSHDVFLHPRKGEPGRTYTFAAGHLGDVSGFDPSAFGLSPREAAEADPQQRLLLEVTAEAIEDAGWRPSDLAGREIGVWVGGSSTDYAELRLSDPAGADRYFMTGNTLSILANRLTNVFDLRGPAQTVDTACSSSLVALHHAVQSLHRGEVEAAVVGGVQLLLSPYAFGGFSKASMLSPTGRCRVFSAAADGYVRAEGAGTVLLKPLSKALADGDTVRAVVLGSGVNSAGRTIGLSLPSGEAQAALIRRVLDRARVSPSRIAYFEAHGTGTPAGDPIETWAISRAVAGAAGRRPRTALPIGSVKGNIGHTEPASGMAGLLKAMLVLQHGTVPPNLHFDTPNPNIGFAALNLRVPVAPEPLPAVGRGAPVVGVNSFGFGGTNATVLVAGAPGQDLAEAAPRARPARTAAAEKAALPPLLLSARSAAALKLLAARWRERLEGAPAPAIPALLRGVARHRDLLPHRLAVRGAGGAALAAALADWSEGRRPAAVTEGVASTVASPGLAFVFSGNGAQFPGMARDALAGSAAFRAGVAEADAALAPLLGWSALERLTDGVEEAALAGTDVAQPLLFAVQAGLLRALAAEGLVPDLVLGHSVGEAAAALAAGILDMAGAARLVVARSAAQHATRGRGRMAALNTSAEDAAPLLAACGPGLEIAARNAPRAVTVAGPAEAIARLAAQSKAQRVNCIPLDLDYAFHSAAMDPVRDQLIRALEGLAPRPAERPFISTVTGALLPGEAADANYWWRNLRAPVRFDEGVTAALREGAKLFLEIGPNPVLQSYLRENARAAQGTGKGGVQAGVSFSLSRRDRPDSFPNGDPIAAVADRATAAGADPRTGPAFAGAAERRLPPTPFARERHWFGSTHESARLHDPHRDHPLLGHRRDGEARQWTRDIDTLLEPWLADHQLGGEAVLPAAAMLEMALAAASRRFPEAAALEVSTFQILRPLPLSEAETRQLRCRLSDELIFTVESRRRLVEEGWTLHARGRLGEATLSALPAEPAGPLPDAPGTLRRVTGAEVTALAARFGLQYGPAFQPLRDVSAGARHARAELVLPPEAPGDAGFLLHPVRLDGALQALIGLLAPQVAEAAATGEALVPVRFERLVWRRDAAPAATAELTLLRAGERSAAAALVLRDASGSAVARAEGATLQRVRLGRAEDAAPTPFRLEDLPEADPALPAPEPALSTALDAARRADEALDLSEAALLLEGWVGVASHRALGSQPAAARRDSPLADSLLRALEEDGLAERRATVADGRTADPRTAAPVAKATTAGAEASHGAAANARDGVAKSRNAAAATDGKAGRAEDWVLLPPDDLPPPENIWREVLAEQPAMAHDLAWLALAAERLPDALAGQGSTLPMPEEGAGNDRLAEVLAAAAGTLAAAWPADRPLRVLDLGGAPLTRRLAVVLAASGRRVLHIVAGENRALPPARGAVEVSAVNWDPASDAPLPVVADLVVGVGAALRHRPGAAPAGVALLPRLAAAMPEGGALLLAEPAPGRVLDLGLGLDPEWWKGRPLPGMAEWREALAAPETASPWQHAEVESLRAAPWPALLVCARRAPAAVPPAEAAPREADAPPILIFADTGATALRDALLEILPAGKASLGGGRLEDAAALPPRRLQGAVVLALANPATEALPTTLASIARLAEAAQGAAARFTVVAQGGGGHPPAEAVRALCRTLCNELPDLSPRRILVDAALSPAVAAARLLPELLSPGTEPEVLLFQSARRVPRLRPGAAEPAAPTAPARLAVRQPGQLGTLVWEPLPRLPAPAPGEVSVRIEAAGLNFRDLMWAQGLLPEETLQDGFAGPGLGMEFAGVVETAGPGVALRPGARVMGFAPRALASHAVTRAEAVCPIPDGMDFAAAATVPVAFLTAAYALDSCARIAPGERVLVHGGAGAVGLASLQVARAAGARVAATAGTEAKRAFLRAAGAELVLDSRDPGFADALRREWPEGVDVVLNSLAGEAMEQSLALLRPWGRFIELGKRDYAEDRRIAVRPFRKNVSYFGVDVDQLPAARPAEAARLIEGIRARLSTGELLPLPRILRRAEEVEEAFRTLQNSGHIGKIVIRPPRGAAVAAPAWTPPEGTILVTGGTAGFGLECAKWLAAHGATRLALVSRRGGATAGIEAALRALGALGARATAHAVDATDPAALAALLAELRAEGGTAAEDGAEPRPGTRPIAGVVHAAAVFDDGAVGTLDTARFARVLGPKLTAAENLDRLTRADAPGLFLLFSSATTPLGNPGQGNYVAANAALEALARARRARGLPALAVGWGPIGDAGVLARDLGTAATLARRLGADTMTAREALDALPALLASGSPVVHLARLGWRRLGSALPVLREPAFAAVREAGGAEGEVEDMRAHLSALPVAEARALLVRVAAEELGRILRLPAESLSADAPVARLGLDSLGGLELRGALEQRLGLSVPLAAVTEDLTIGGLATRVIETLQGGKSEETQVAALLEHFEPTREAAQPVREPSA
ncbi:SDR family NAD(P)-dependent oxidoreductase [Roseomonas sp. BN140053]|uniref:SDR family NAD(P)-dependent oxidoreductase n=1 Tax=Roseomonas sp. BN140053 TaxID=3391898 RepID=UPI0039EB4A6B